jgi:hypothetical protein
LHCCRWSWSWSRRGRYSVAWNTFLACRVLFSFGCVTVEEETRTECMHPAGRILHVLLFVTVSG